MSRSLKQAVHVLASVRLAVVTMAALGVACIAATFYEASHGTAAAQRVFYRAPWFAALLGLLAASIALSALERYPWSRHQAGFVLAHAGVLLLLLGSVVSLHAGLDGRLTLVEGETSDGLALAGEEIRVSWSDGSGGALPVDFSAHPPAPGSRLELPGAALVLEEYAPSVRIDDVWAEGTGQADGPAALQFSLVGQGDPLVGWLMSGAPGPSAVDLGPIRFTLSEAPDERTAQALLARAGAVNEAAFVATPDRRLRVAMSARHRPRVIAEPAVGEPFASPWMNLRLRVDRFLARAVPQRVVAHVPVTGRRSGEPAVRARLVAAGASAEAWVAFGESRPLVVGDRRAELSYGPPPAALPFRVTLLDFDSLTYPGTRMPATYESRVRVDDPEQGSFERTISMNHPLHHRGYTLFQSSYVDGVPQTSILSVARAPGLPLVYLGTALIAAGTLWMSFFKRWLARRQGRAALSARRHLLPAVLAVLAIGGATSAAAAGAGAGTGALREVAIQDGGRVKPLDTFARESARRVGGARPFTGGETVAGLDAVDWLVAMLSDPERWQGVPFVRVAHADVRARLGLPADRDRYSYAELVGHERLLDAVASVRDKAERDEALEPVEHEIANLEGTLVLFRGLLNGEALRIVPIEGASGGWMSVADLAPGGEGERLAALREAVVRLVAADSAGGSGRAAAAAALRADLRATGGAHYPAADAIEREVAYNRLKPFRLAWLLYLAAFLALLPAVSLGSRLLGGAGVALVAGGLIATTGGLWMRTVISGRAPVTNMYETVVFAAWGAVALALVFEAAYGGRIAAACASGLAVLALLLADNVPILDGSIAPLVPVLRDNVWLTLHVLTITLGYAAFLLAMGLGHVNLAFLALAPGRPVVATLTRFLHRSLQVGTVFLAVGTLLGGVWASYSWGRFWGWDPKETWALIALLGYLAVLHGRLAGWLGDFGLAMGAVGGFLLVLMAWYGVNYVLGTGLHAYGFGSGGAGWVFAFAAVELVVMVMAAARHAALVPAARGRALREGHA
jgi:ABC-type transport system involved in cytochrome c biogenesis permease subunit